MTNWICPRCGHNFKSECPICEVCTEIAYEKTSQDVLDDYDTVSIDEVLEEIEGRDDDEDVWGY